MTVARMERDGKYGAKPLPGRRLRFDSEASQALIERYLSDG
jgi:hypothetical protein